MNFNKNDFQEYQVDPSFPLGAASSARVQYHPTNPFYDDIQRTIYEEPKTYYHEFTDNHVSNDNVFGMKNMKDACTEASKILMKDSLKNIECYNTIESSEAFSETDACRTTNKLNKRSYSDSMQNLYPKTCQARCVTCQKHYQGGNIPMNCVSDISNVSQRKHNPVISFKESNCNRNHQIDESKQHIHKSVYSSPPQKCYQLKKFIEEMKKHQKNVAWHNYINELKNKHGYRNESPVHITNDYTPDDEPYLTTNTSESHNRSHCKMLLRYFYEAYKEVFELTHEHMNNDFQDLTLNSDGKFYNSLFNSLQCYPTSSQGRVIALERERNTRPRWQYSPVNNTNKFNNQYSNKISKSTNYDPIKNQDKFTIVTDQISSIYCSDQVNTEQSYCKWRSSDRQCDKRKRIVKFEFEDGDCYEGSYVAADKEYNNSCDLRNCDIDTKEVSINCKIGKTYQLNKREYNEVLSQRSKEGNSESIHQKMLNFNDPPKIVNRCLKFKDNALQIPDKLVCNTNETIMPSQLCGYPNDNTQNAVQKSSSMQTLLVNPSSLNKEDKAIDKRKTVQDKYKNVTNDVDKLTKRVQSTQNFEKHSALSNIEVKIGDLVKSINSFVKEIKINKNMSSNKSTLINMTKTDSKLLNDLTKNTRITKTESILCNMLNNAESSSELLSNCDLSKLDLFYDIDKNDQVTRDNEDLEYNKHDFALQITFDNPTQERATVTESVSLEDIDRKNTVEIASNVLNDRCVTIAVNTDPLGFLALLTVSSEALRGILSYIPNINYQAFLPTPQLTQTTAAAGYVCNICDANFQRPLDLGEHILSHDLGNKRNCCVCPHASDKWRRRPPRSFNCKYCELQFLRAYCCELHQQACAKNFGLIHDISSNLMILK